MSDYNVIPAQDVAKIKAAGGTILDVRRPDEHDEQRLQAPHAFVPLDQLNPADFMLRHGLDREAPVYILCRSGMRARKAADAFGVAGYKNISVIDGGILACAAAGEPVTGDGVAGAPSAAAPAPQSKVIPLERQVRIAAGALVALGVVLGRFIHPLFYLLSFGVGAGLVYAGITDHCGMALVLLRAPWNKGANCTTSGSCAANACGGPGLPKTPSGPKAGGCA